eukprot:gene18530-25036_t
MSEIRTPEHQSTRAPIHQSSANQVAVTIILNVPRTIQVPKLCQRSEHQSTSPPENQSTSPPGHLSTRAPAHQSTSPPENQSTSPPGHLSTRAPAHQSSADQVAVTIILNVSESIIVSTRLPSSSFT